MAAGTSAPLLQGLTEMVVVMEGHAPLPAEAEVVVVVTPLQGLVVLMVVVLVDDPGMELPLSAQTETEVRFSIMSTCSQGTLIFWPLKTLKQLAAVSVTYFLTTLEECGSGIGMSAGLKEVVVAVLELEVVVTVVTVEADKVSEILVTPRLLPQSHQHFSGMTGQSLVLSHT